MLRNNRGFGLLEAVVGMAIASVLALLVFSLIAMLNAAIIRAAKAQIAFSKKPQEIVCTPSENGNSGTFKCVAVERK